MSQVIRQIQPDEWGKHIQDLSGILHSTVLGGASVGFIQPFAPKDAAQFWQDKIFPAVAAGQAILFGAFVDQQLRGTVLLDLDLPPNQPHRANVAKLLVHPAARRLGLGRALMQAVEAEARIRSKTLLLLDTRSGDPSQRLYESMGYQVAGVVPGFCRHPEEEVFESTTFLYKPLG